MVRIIFFTLPFIRLVSEAINISVAITTDVSKQRKPIAWGKVSDIVLWIISNEWGIRRKARRRNVCQKNQANNLIA